MLTISGTRSLALSEEFREAVAYSMNVLGEQVASSFYYYAKRQYDVDLSGVPAEVDRFDQALRTLFGNGSTVVVRECAKRLIGSLGVRIEPLPVSLGALYRKVSESLRLRKWVSPLDRIVV